ncbi:putative P450 monooxygenase [Myriangium duriaei CBS 260.36]|uniref:Bifunctional cytochrome P450/NADPH--P450 reductase n=1 Tax=Myriangium duriaei CBS 260.36 TaxID=1168546 RepID=A0A9P4MH74_9PEZI|nr:putative P450 monooxygenase [Myriangium duriaei CBS 260.36]
MSELIPSPPGLPVLGNIFDIDPSAVTGSIERLMTQYGPFIKLRLLGKDQLFCGSYELFNELTDDRRFRKAVHKSLVEVRNGVGGGLFTAFPGEHDWEVAHRVLVPAFGPLPIKNMFDEMHDICSQMILRWSRNGSSHKIVVSEDFTKLTLDSIALCAMDTRFNSFYHEQLHPFVQAMVDFLLESGYRTRRPAVAQMFLREANRRYDADIATMKSVAAEVIAQRRKFPSNKQDLLNAMLLGKDPRTGEAMSDESIMNNMITFLIAGHETTAGLLSFTIYYMLKNPETWRKAQEEVDQVLDKHAMEYKHIPNLNYVQACLRESIRLSPTAPAIGRESASDKDEIIGGKYLVPAGTSVICMLSKIQQDPEIFGDDAMYFKPERMLTCIGRPFAWQEAVMALAMVIQNFDLHMVDPGYELRIKQTLTIKPDGFEVYATPRTVLEPGQLERRLFGGATSQRPTDHLGVKRPTDQRAKPMTVLYGSNTGTCEGLAQSLANSAVGHGYSASVATLDSALGGKVPMDQPVLIITASFEGAPANNAGQFVDWLLHVDGEKIKGVKYAVFGCGHSDWVSTYQKVPTLIDDELTKKGAERLTERGESDVAAGNIFDDFDSWIDGKFWPALSSGSSVEVDINPLDVEITSSSRVSTLKQGVFEALVEQSKLLSGPGVSEKRMISFKLPSGISYIAGDYLDVLPLNPLETVSRVLNRFGLAWDSDITIKSNSHTTLPVGTKQPASILMGSYVELGTPASRKQILTLSRLTQDEVCRKQLEGLAANISQSRISVLDVLEDYPQLHVPFGLFLSMLPPMRVRQYSISSSPIVDPTVASITYNVLNVTSDGKSNSKPFLGVTTNFLKTLQIGGKAQISIKKSHYSFHLPPDPLKPIIMVCAGTGLAPFRAFVEERAAIIRGGRKVGPAMLFVGCKNRYSDGLYAAEFEAWEGQGAVKVFYAFSQDQSASKDCRYAQERIYAEKEQVYELFEQGAKVFICGAGRLGNAVKATSKKLFMERAKERGHEKTEPEADEWFEGLKVQERWSSDVFD